MRRAKVKHNAKFPFYSSYDDLLMASVRVIAEQEDNKGYLR